jgi:hypothetical protein
MKSGLYYFTTNNQTKRVAVFCHYNIPCILGEKNNTRQVVFSKNTNIGSGYFNYVSISATGQYQTTVQRTQDDNIDPNCKMSFIWISNDAGKTWTNVSKDVVDLIQNWTCTSISSNGQYQIASYQPGLIYISKNWGKNWEKTNSPDASWYGVAISGNGQYLLGVSNLYKSDENSNVYLSSNLGESWTNKLTSKLWLNCAASYTGQYMAAIAFSDKNEVNPETGILPVGSVYVSNNYGVDWNPCTIKDYFTNVAISESGQYILVCSNDCNYGPALPRPLYLSNNFGISWKTINLNDTWISVAISKDGQFQSAVSYYQGADSPSSGYVYESNDYGATWNKNESASQDEWTGIAMSANGNIRSLVSSMCGNLYNSY